MLQKFRVITFAAGVALLAGCAGPGGSVGPTLTTVALPDPMVVSRAAPLPDPVSKENTPDSLPLPFADSQPPPLLTGKPWPSEWVNVWVPLASWTRMNGLASPMQMASGTASQFSVRTPHGSIRVRAGSQIVYIHGHDCALGHPARMVGGFPYVHSLDLEKTLQPLLSGNALRSSPSRTIVVDPGHGGKDSGTKGRSSFEQEKHYALDWALRLERMLVAEGWKVYLTRTNDIDVSLADRVSLAEQVRSDLFVSLHFNSGSQNSEMSGVETYCLTPTGLPSTLRRDYEDDPREKYPNNAFDHSNVVLASQIHKAILGTTGAPDRGVRRARFMTVLRGQNRPAILVEGGYLSNPNEAVRIASPAYRQALAEGVASALIAHEPPGSIDTRAGSAEAGTSSSPSLLAPARP